MTLGLANPGIVVVNALTNLTGERLALFTGEGVVVLDPAPVPLRLAYKKQDRIASVTADIREVDPDAKAKSLLVAEPFNAPPERPAEHTAVVQVFKPPEPTGFAEPVPRIPPTSCGVLVTPEVAAYLAAHGWCHDDDDDDEEEDKCPPAKRQRRQLCVFGINPMDARLATAARSLIRYPFTV